MDLLITAILSFISFIFSYLPKLLCGFFFLIILKTLLFFSPRYKKIAEKNLAIAFPDITASERNNLIHKHLHFLAKLLTDSLTIKKHNRKWCEKNITFSNRDQILQIANDSNTGILIVTGHLGSFELHAYTHAQVFRPLSFVVRRLKLPRLNTWWNNRRESHGNLVIERDGAYKKIIKTLKSGRDVGILFDQNVTATHAVFVQWFILDAATTKAVALAAISTDCPVVITALVLTQRDKYEEIAVPCDLESIRNNPELSKEDKVRKITQLLTNTFCELIKKYPEQWFWFHRRWKTRADGKLFNYLQ